MTTTTTSQTVPQRLAAELRRIKRSTTTPPAYAALVARTVELQVIASYLDDLLVHDKAGIAQHPPCFAWTIGSFGTHLVLPDWDLALPTIDGLLHSYGDYLPHWWDGRQLHVLPGHLTMRQRMVDALAEQDALGLTRWRRPPLPRGTTFVGMERTYYGMTGSTFTLKGAPVPCDCGQHPAGAVWAYPIKDETYTGIVCAKRLRTKINVTGAEYQEFWMEEQYHD